jgi:hypothetical protein
MDTHVTHVMACGGGDEKRPVALAEHMETDKPLRDRSAGAVMHTRSQQYEGLYRVAKRLERLAEGSAGRLEAPCLHERLPLTKQSRADACRDPPVCIAVLLVRLLNTPRVGQNGAISACASGPRRVREYSEGQ